MPFDVQAFQSARQVGANATVTKPIPVGTYTGFIEKGEIKEWSSNKPGGASGLKYSYLVNITQPVDGFAKPMVRGEIMLDLADGGGLAMGDNDNVRLGKLRAAINLNNPNEPWSFDMFMGRPLRVSVKHRVDANDPTKVYAEVDSTFPPA